MLNVVYLVLVFKLPMVDGVASLSIPQANMAQCQVNAKNYSGKENIRNVHCIAGVMPK